jgi:ATP-dependent RNA helicase DDX31/DBP7
MADDGMLMNFDLGDAPLIAKPTFKGGRWKDRLSAKKVAKHREARMNGEGGPKRPLPANREIIQNPRYNAVEEEYIGPGAGSRGPKRQRVEADYHNDAGRQTARVTTGKLPPGSISIGGGGGKKTLLGVDGKPTQIISSLFSFNPSSKTKFDDEEPKEEAEPAKPSNAPLSDEFASFTTLGMSRRLAGHLATKLEMKAPTAIQKAAVPQLIADDSDAFIQAQTGSGKTLAYLLPIVERIMAISASAESEGGTNPEKKIHRNSGLFAIVLAPTRELCKQIAMVLDKLLRCAPWLVGTTVIGGESKQSEKARLRKGVNILIATPGRLADHLDNTTVLDVSTVRWLVLDEGDRLMELGFEEEIKGIVDKIAERALVNDRSGRVGKGQLPSRRVTILCSATMKMTVQKLGEISLKDAVHIQADPSEEELEKSKADGTDAQDAGFSAPAQLKQEYGIVPAKLRLVTLTAVLKRAFARRGSVMKAIVFISCADSVDFHFSLFSRPETAPPPVSGANGEEEKPAVAVIPKNELTKDTIAAATAFSNLANAVTLHKLHGSLAQNIRTATLKHFSESKDPAVLICTDVASRGLDLPNVDFVIEYDPPFASEDHVHRIGRTARAGKSGRSLIFLLPGTEEGYVPILSKLSPNLTANTAEELIRKGFGGTGHEWEERATEWQLEVEKWILESPKYLEMARRGYQSHIRAYATHVAAERSIFDMKELHLGHLAKAFGLRDKPGSIKVPGLRPKAMTHADRSVAMRKAKRGDNTDRDGNEKAPEGEYARKKKKEERDRPKEVDAGDAAKRMKRKMMEHMGAASEFNIG